MGHAVRKIGAPPQAVDAMFRQAGVIQVDTLDEMFDVAQLVAHQPLPRGPPGRDRRQLRRARAARRRRRGRGRPGGQPARSRSAPTPPAEDFEDALDAAIDDPEVDSVVAVYIPPLNVSGVEVANVLAAVGEQSDKPLVSTFLGAEGVPELLRVPDVAGSTAGRGSVPSYPAVEAAVRALARVVEYAVWLRTPERRDRSTPDDVDPARPRRRWSTRLLIDAPRRRASSTGDELHALLAAYGIDAVGGAAGHHR